MSRLEDLKHALSSWTPGGPPAATWLLPELRALLGAQFTGAYRPVATEAGWSLAFMYGDGARASDHVGVFREYVGALPRSERFLTICNPHFVDREQRNRVLSIPDISTLGTVPNFAEPAEKLFRALGIAGHDQLRVLLCDGPKQLAWVGATREEPFTARDAALVRRLVRPLGERFRLEHQLAAPGLLAATLDAVLDALPAAAFVVGPSGSIEVANRAGLMLLDRGSKAVLDSIRKSAAHEPDSGAFSVTRICAPGWPSYLLAVQEKRDGILEHVSWAQARWGLSVRQARVLELVAGGASNKEIATALACAEVTVENHITELFRRSGARSRAGLVGLLLVR